MTKIIYRPKGHGDVRQVTKHVRRLLTKSSTDSCSESFDESVILNETKDTIDGHDFTFGNDQD